jgi:putative GTP pyrophosphokinase
VPDDPPDPVTIVAAPVREAVRQYAALQPRLVGPTLRFVELVTALLDDAGINYLSVTGRTKSVASFAAKAARTLPHVPEGAADTGGPLAAITDQIGVRVITYVQADVAAVVDLLADQLRILDDRDLGEETARQGRFGYGSRHLLVTPDDASPAAYDELAGLRASIQVRTVLQHAWAEFEHDIRYKGTLPADSAPDLDRRFTLAAGLLELADREFSAIRASLDEVATDPTESDPSDPRITGHELAAYLAGHYTDAGWSREAHYDWIAGLVLELGVTSLAELADLLSSVDADAVIARMGYRHPAGAVRRLDDALLAIFGRRYVDLTGNSHRVPLLTARLDKLG